ncbi:MAG TPA: MMPL family transporter [Sporichthya sp.]|nr:MMPL family transporter [Sporichthya sp.]
MHAGNHGGLAARLGGWSARHRKSAVAGWLLFVVLASVLGGLVGTRQLADHEIGAGDSARADTILADAGIENPAQELVLLHSSDADGWRAAAEELVAKLHDVRLDGQNVVSTVDDTVASPDGKDGLVRFDLAGDYDSAVRNGDPIFTAVNEVRAAHPGIEIHEVGDASVESWFDKVIGKDFQRAEWTAVPLALGILLVAFGAMVAALVPVVLAVTAFLAALGLLGLFSHVVPVDDSTSSVMLLMGLAVGVDYALFYLRREREERAAGRSKEAALAAAAATSGHSVLVSGLTVMAAMAGMFLSGMALFEGFAMATILVVFVAMAGSVTVLPAVLSLLGDRVDRGRPASWFRRGPAQSHSGRAKARSGRWVETALRPVLHRPKVAVAVGTGALLLLALPVTTMKTAQLDVDQQAPGTEIAVAYQKLTEAFPTGPLPAQVVLKVDDTADPRVDQALAAFRDKVSASDSFGDPVQVTTHQKEGVITIDVPLAGDGSDSTSKAALTELRTEVVPQTLGTAQLGERSEARVSGMLAQSEDFDSQLHDGLIPVLICLALITFAVMAFAFRSWVIAATALVLNLLSVGAAFGVMTAVFQHGWGAGLFGTDGVGAIEAWIPMFTLVILFGLSTDYHVFVVSRIREARESGMDNTSAVRHGIARTAGVVTSAAAIMVGVFAVFATLSMQDFKQMGVGLAAAVAIDATVIRIVLLPAVMTLLGDRNWPGRKRSTPKPTAGAHALDPVGDRLADPRNVVGAIRR